MSKVEENSLSEIRGLVDLKIEGGHVRTLPKDLGNMPQLLGLSLTDNAIPAINQADLRSTANLVHLDFSQNLLMFVEESTFTGYSKLVNLFLNSNQLTFLYPKTFDDLIMLSWIDLSYNRIKSFDGLFNKLNPVVSCDRITQQVLDIILTSDIGQTMSKHVDIKYR